MKIDPTQRRDQHCKVYLEKDVVDEIKSYQSKNGFRLASFSETLRALILHGLESERQATSVVSAGVQSGNIKIYDDPRKDPKYLNPLNDS